MEGAEPVSQFSFLQAEQVALYEGAKKRAMSARSATLHYAVY